MHKITASDTERESLKELRQAREPLSALAIIVMPVIHTGHPRLNMPEYRLRDIMRAPQRGKHCSCGPPQIMRRPMRHRQSGTIVAGYLLAVRPMIVNAMRNNGLLHHFTGRRREQKAIHSLVFAPPNDCLGAADEGRPQIRCL